MGVRIRTQMDKLGVKAVFEGTSGIVSDAYIEGLGPLAEGTLAFREGAPVEKLPGGKVLHRAIPRRRNTAIRLKPTAPSHTRRQVWLSTPSKT